MEEKELIKQLKTLQSIRPSQDWVALTKKGLFVQEPVEARPKTPGVITNLFSLFERHTVAFSVAAFAGLVVIGGLFYFTNHAVLKTHLAYKGLEELLAKVVSESKSNEAMLTSLEGLQEKLEDVKLAVDNLKRAKDQGQALVMTEIVKTTAKEGKEVMKRIKDVDSGLSKQVLASLVEFDALSEEVVQKSSTVQKEILGKYLQDLKQRSLSSEDRERLSKAEELYSQGKEAEAMILIGRIGGR